MIKSAQLTSAALSGCEYDTDTKTLSVTFVNGGTYDHHDVPEEIYEGLIVAVSPGRYWHAYIKDIYT